MDEKCIECITLLDESLIPNSDELEALVDFKKLRGDYFRYRSEIYSGDDQKEFIWDANESYKDAVRDAEKL